MMSILLNKGIISNQDYNELTPKIIIYTFKTILIHKSINQAGNLYCFESYYFINILNKISSRYFLKHILISC